MHYIKYTVEKDIIEQEKKYFSVILTEEDPQETVWDHMFNDISQVICDYLYELTACNTISITRQEKSYSIERNNKPVVVYSIVNIQH